MDPIHPILPRPANIPPVTPATNAGRVDRDGQRHRQADEERRRRSAAAHSDPPDAAADAGGGDGDGDDGLHIDITA